MRDPRAQRYAIDLGIAMQLTNICRDVLEDAESGRVYLPAERLEPYGVTQEQLVRGEADPIGVGLVVSELLDMAEGYYRAGDEGSLFLPPRARWAVLIASRLYRGIGKRLRRKHQCNPLVGRTVVPWFEKVAWVVRASIRCLGLSWLSSGPQAPRGTDPHLEGLPYVALPQALRDSAIPRRALLARPFRLK